MMSEIKYVILILIFLLNVINGSCQHKGENLVKNDFINPPLTVKIHTWWHLIDGVITRRDYQRFGVDASAGDFPGNHSKCRDF